MSKKQAWIPITEQLPPDGQKCWTYQPVNDAWYRFEEIVSAHQFHENCRDDWGGWWIGVEKDAGNFALWSNITIPEEGDPVLLITHWMPYEIPEPHPLRDILSRRGPLTQRTCHLGAHSTT
jgi:hypothetical protein